MKLPQLRKNGRKNYLPLAFGLPCGMMLILMFICSAEPFGSQTMLYSDQFHQYFPFFNAYRTALRSGESLLWNWSVGMGMDYLGLISYYLGSPLNLLSVLVPDGWVLGYFALLMPLKLGFAGFSFAYMMKKLYGKNDLSLALFGGLYGLCAWALGYQWNVMWLDTFAILPLVALGTVVLLRDKKFKLYTLSLFFAVAINYYVGFFVCIFVFLLFWCYEICRFKSIGKCFADLLRIGAFTVLALGMTACITLPAFASLQNTYSSVNQFPDGFQMNMISGESVTAARQAWEAYKAAKEAGEPAMQLLLDALKAGFGPIMEGMLKVSGQIGGGLKPTYIDGLPNLYCGVFPVALGFLFLLAREIRIRDKLCTVGLLVLFMLSFLIRQLDYMWHGFHFTNQIPYRFSFLFSFVVLYMAYRAWLLRDRFKIWQIVAAGILSAGLFLLSEDTRNNSAYLSFNLAFLGLYFVALLYGHRHFLPEHTQEDPEDTEDEEEAELPQPMPLRRSFGDLLPSAPVRRKHATTVISLTLVLELTLTLVNFGTSFGIYEYDYPKKNDTVQDMLTIMKDRDEELFYRTEVTHTQTLNDGALNGYYGISTFSSSANVNVTRFTKALGAGAYDSWNRYCYEESSPVSNLFLNLKYLIDRGENGNIRGENAYFDTVHSYDGVTLLENNAYLPLGFLAETALADVKLTGDTFDIQNRMFAAATGLEGKVWSVIPARDVTVVAENVTVQTENSGGYTSFSTGESNCKLMYQYNITEEGFLCLDLNLYKQKNYTVWHNGVRLFREGYSLPQSMAVCNVQPGDTVQVVIECTPNMENTSISLKAAILNEGLFRRGYDVLNASTLTLTEFSSTYLSGTISCNRRGLLYTSIPQDGNWVAYVDGEEAETVLVGEAMLGIVLSAGDHTVEFKYKSTPALLGLGVSLACGLLFVQFIVFEKKRK